MTITYCEGDATQPIGDGHKLIVHVCNNRGGWGAGFTGALSRRWSEPERMYRAWARSGDSYFRLGSVQVAFVGEDITVVNMLAQDGYAREGGSIVYEALRSCLKQVDAYAKIRKASVHMPRIGCGWGGGYWNEVEPIVADTLRDLNVFVYDLKTRPRRETQYDVETK